jgi:hypothetical protein
VLRIKLAVVHVGLFQQQEQLKVLGLSRVVKLQLISHLSNWLTVLMIFGIMKPTMAAMADG